MGTLTIACQLVQRYFVHRWCLGGAGVHDRAGQTYLGTSSLSEIQLVKMVRRSVPKVMWQV